MLCSFTKRKFLSFSLERRHKKCLEILRLLYESGSSMLLNHYNELQEWMVLDPLTRPSREEISDRFHEHLSLAKLSLKEHRLLPPIRKGDRSKKGSFWPIAIYLDHIRSAHNVGSIIRTAEAFSLGKLYFSKKTPFADHPQVQKTSMGCTKGLQCFQNISLEDLPRPLIALETSDQAFSLFSFIFPKSFTIALGNEEYGCSQDVLSKADFILEIPLRGWKNSLNVANAFAILAAEIARQKVL